MIEACDIRNLNSIFSTIESIKKKHPHFKIKIYEIDLEKYNPEDHDRLFEIISSFSVTHVNIER